jgi:uncharacterized Zn finger protein
MAARKKPSFDDRVAEYVDSPLVTCRVRYGKKVSARIQGNYGVYRTFVAPDSKKLTGDCSCPSEILLCKHVHALRETWNANPKSFFDLDAWLKQLSRQSKEELVESIGMMVVEAPELLGLFGVEGFEVGDDEPYYD